MKNRYFRKRTAHKRRNVKRVYFLKSNAENISNSNIVQGNRAKNLYVLNISPQVLIAHEIELFQVFNKLDISDREKVLAYATELRDKNKPLISG